MFAEKNTIVRQLDHTIRCLIIESGIIAASPALYSQPINTRNMPADPQNKPIIVALPHAYVVLPHSSARRNMIAVGAKSKNPMISRD